MRLITAVRSSWSPAKRATGCHSRPRAGCGDGRRPARPRGAEARLMRLFWIVVLTAWLPRAASAQSLDTTFDSNGVPIRYVMSGTGEPIVLIHGWSASAEMWDPIRAELSNRYRVIAMDCRGHGRSGKPHEPGAYGIEMVNDVVRLLDHLHIQQPDHVINHLDAIGTRLMRLAAASVAAAIHSDDPIAIRQLGANRVPHFR